MGISIAFGAGISANFLWGPVVGTACGIAAGIIKNNNSNSSVARSLDNVGRQISQNTSVSTPIYGGNSSISNNIQNSPLSIKSTPILTPSITIPNCKPKTNITQKTTSNNQSIKIQPKTSSNISKASTNSLNKPKISIKKEEKKVINKISSNNMKPATPAFNTNINNSNKNIKTNTNSQYSNFNSSNNYKNNTYNNNNIKINKKNNCINSNFTSFSNNSIYENKLKDFCSKQKEPNSINFSSKFNNYNSISFNNSINHNIIEKNDDDYFYNTNSNFYPRNNNYFNNSNSNLFNDNDNYFYNTNSNFYSQRNRNNNYNNNYNDNFSKNTLYRSNTVSNFGPLSSLEDVLNYNFDNKKNYFNKYQNNNLFKNYNKNIFNKMKFCPKNNAELIYDKLIEEGCTKEGAAGLLGNLSCESGLKSVIYENSKKREIGMSDQEYVNNVNSGKYKNFINDRAGFGLAQWTSRDRKLALLNHCRGDIGNIEKQLDFLIDELKTKYPRVWRSLTTSKDVKTCSDKVVMEFERPKDYASLTVRNRRYKESLKFYK